MMWTLPTPLLERFQAGFDFGDHAGLDAAVGDQLPCVGGGERIDQRFGSSLSRSDAVDVAEENRACLRQLPERPPEQRCRR